MAADSRLEQLSKTDRNPVEETEYQNLLKAQGIQFTVDPGNKTNVAGFGYGGNNANTDQFVNAVVNQTPSGSQQSTINLPQMYDSMYKSSGITESQAQFDALTKDIEGRRKRLADATALINDNPFYSEGTRVGRVAKLNDIANADLGILTDQQNTILGDIARRKADVETKINLETKQFDINSQQAQQELERFNYLLQAGALDNASNLELARLAKATGIPTSMIDSAIKFNIKKNTPKEEPVPTQFVSFDDGVNSGFALINSQTGEIIKKETLAVAQEKKSGSGKATESEKREYYENSLRADAQKGLTLSQIFGLYTGYIEPDKIYQLYNATSRYGPHKGDVSDVAKYGVTQP